MIDDVLPRPESQFGRARLVFLATFFVLGCAGLATVYGLGLNSPPIRSDGVGYYLYLPAIVIERDASLATTAEKVFGGRIPAWTGAIAIGDTGRYVLQYWIGEAILLLPFFLMGLLLAWIAEAPLHGFSWPFQLFAAVSGLVYAGFGIGLLWRTLERWFSERSIAVAMTGIVYGTNFFHYATYDSIFSHAYSFFLFAALLWSAQTIFLDGRVGRIVLLGAIVAMVTLVRPTNILWAVAGIGFGLTSVPALRERLRFTREHAPLLIGGLVVFAAILSIQLIYWKTVTGNWIVDSYSRYHFNFFSPQIASVLFSVRKGLFFWSPLWITVVPGAWFLARRAPAITPGVLFFLPLHLYIVSSYWSWWYGGAFGHRGFVEALPVLALCLAALYEVATERYRGGRGIVLTLVAACVTWSVWLMLKYWTRVIPFDNVTWEHFSQTFFQLTR